MIHWLFRLGAFLTRIAPLKLSYAVARALGALVYLAWPGGRRRAQRNLLRVTGGDRQTARRAARRSFQNYAVYLVDFLRLVSQEQHEIRQRVEFDAWDTLIEERSGHGIVLITIHFGNWDLGAAALALEGYPVSALAHTFADPRVNDMVVRSREHLGMRIIPADRIGPGVLRALRNNDVVAVLVDIPERNGVRVQFCGETIAVPDGPARIALRTGASVVAAVAPRVTPWQDRVRASIVPVSFEPSGNTENDIQQLTQAMFSRLEPFVRADPAQWYIFRNLWIADDESASTPAP